MKDTLPLGKIPPELLVEVLAAYPLDDPRLILGPGIGLDCAVIDLDGQFLVLKSDPITFASEEIGWYAVQVNANDIATTGATPRWFLATLLFPEAKTDPALVLKVNRQLQEACGALGIALVGGHSEVAFGIDRVIVAGTMIGEVERDRLVTPAGAAPGDRILLTKSVPIEATAILAREFASRLRPEFTDAEIREATSYLYRPGISVVRDARIATQAGKVSAMHDPTEGGLLAALWELAQACQHCLLIDPAQVPVTRLSRRLCQSFGLNPLGAIASGALLLAAAPEQASAIRSALATHEIPCEDIGEVQAGPTGVWVGTKQEKTPLQAPRRDEIARLFEEEPPPEL